MLTNHLRSDKIIGSLKSGTVNQKKVLKKSFKKCLTNKTEYDRINEFATADKQNKMNIDN